MKEKLEFELTAGVKTPGASESTKQLTALYQVMDKINNAADKSSDNVFKMNIPNMSPMLDQLKTRLNKGPVNTMYGPGSQSQMMSDLTDKVSTTNYADIANSITTASSSMESFKQKLDASNPAAKALNVTISDSAKRVLQLSYDYQKNANEIDENKRRQRGFNDELSKGSGLVKQLKNSFNALGMVQMVYLYRSVRRVTSGLVSMVENAANFEESMNLYAMSFGKYAERANAWMDRITDKLKLDPSAVMQYAGAFNNLVKGMGVTSDAAYVMSTNLTQLTYDMASYLNISNEAAQAKIQSAMAGQSRAVASVGIAMQVASLQELAYSLNIKKKVSEMTQAEKTYLRYIQLLRSTTHMQGDLGKTMMTPANAIRVLKQQLNLLSRAIGQVLTPIIMNVIPYVMAFTNVLRRAAKAVADFFGYAYTDVGNDAYAVTFEDITDGLDGVGDSATEAGKKIKNGLAPFDELNQVMSESAGTGKGGSGSGGTNGIISDLEKYVSGYDMLSKYTGDLAKKAEGLEGTVQKILTAVGVLLGGKLLVDLIPKLIKIGKFIGDIFDVLIYSGGLSKVAKFLSSIGGQALIIAAGLGVIHDTQGKLNKEVGELYGLQKYGTQDTFWSWIPGVAKGFSDAAHDVHKFTGAMAESTSWFSPLRKIALYGVDFIAGFFDQSDKFAEGEAKAIETRINYLYEALNRGSKISDIYDPSAVFGNLTYSVEEWTKILTSGSPALQQYNSDLAAFNSTIGNLYSSFTEHDKQVELYGYKIQATGQLTKEETQNIKGHIDGMLKDTGDMIETRTNRNLEIWGNAMKTGTTLTDTEQKNMLNAIINNGKEQEKELSTAQTNITKTYDNAIKTRGYLTDEEYKYIQGQLDKIRTLTEKQMSQTQTDIEFAIDKINAGEKLSADGMKNFYSSVDKYRDEELDRISKTYNDEKNLIEGTYKKGTTEYETYMGDAYQRRVNSENELFKKIENYEGAISGTMIQTYIDAKNSGTEEGLAFAKWIEDKLGPDVASKLGTIGSDGNSALLSAIFKEEPELTKQYLGKLLGGNLSDAETKELANKLKTKIAAALKTIKLPLPINIDVLVDKYLGKGSKGNANGGVLENGDYFHMNERGNAEFLGSIGGQKAVVNQSQMVQSLAMVITGAMANMGFNGNQSGTVVVNIGNKKVYEGQGEYQNRENDRYGTTVVRV